MIAGRIDIYRTLDVLDRHKEQLCDRLLAYKAFSAELDRCPNRNSLEIQRSMERFCVSHLTHLSERRQ